MSDTITEEEAKKSRWRFSPLIGWLVAVVPPILYPVVIIGIGVLWSLVTPPVERPEHPSYPGGVKNYDNLSPEQKEGYRRDVREWRERIDKPYRDFHLYWMGVMVASFLGCLTVYLTSPLRLFNAWNILALVSIVAIYSLIGFFMFIAWIFRHG